MLPAAIPITCVCVFFVSPFFSLSFTSSLSLSLGILFFSLSVLYKSAPYHMRFSAVNGDNQLNKFTLYMLFVFTPRKKNMRTKYGAKPPLIPFIAYTETLSHAQNTTLMMRYKTFVPAISYLCIYINIFMKKIHSYIRYMQTFSIAETHRCKVVDVFF